VGVPATRDAPVGSGEGEGAPSLAGASTGVR